MKCYLENKSCSPDKAHSLGRWEIRLRTYFKLQVQKLYSVTFGGDTSYFPVLLSDFSRGLVTSDQWDWLFHLCFPPSCKHEPDTQLGWLGCDWGWSQSQDLELPVWADLSLLIMPVSPRASFLQKPFPCFHLLAYPQPRRAEEHANVTILGSKWGIGRAGRLVSLQGQPGGKHLADQGLA